MFHLTHLPEVAYAIKRKTLVLKVHAFILVSKGGVACQPPTLLLLSEGLGEGGGKSLGLIQGVQPLFKYLCSKGTTSFCNHLQIWSGKFHFM